jgi:hypothetical protein
MSLIESRLKLLENKNSPSAKNQLKDRAKQTSVQDGIEVLLSICIYVSIYGNIKYLHAR